ncbi:MAG: hypothetical protein HKM93_12015 [Desulfobacteraceae bacterium]|nr:hypothetical protein [Desulfobacteraceae bacterium]
MFTKFLTYRYLWWIGQGLLTAAGCFFIFFGISLLIASYKLDNPFTFIMTFFASNLIILISGALVAGFLFRLRAVYQELGKTDDDE